MKKEREEKMEDAKKKEVKLNLKNKKWENKY